MSKKEENKESGRFWLFLIPSWGIFVLFLLIFFINSGWPPKTPETLHDIAYLVVALIFFVFPFISRIKVGKLLELERSIKETREGIDNFKNEMRQMFFVLSSASATATNINNLVIDGVTKEKLKKESELEERPKTASELKILNTLWQRQLLKFPDIDGFWTFALNVASLEFLNFRESGNRLMGEGLITETNIGQYRLTAEGLLYCAEHYPEFPPDMWVEKKDIPEGNLDKLLKNIRALKPKEDTKKNEAKNGS